MIWYGGSGVNAKSTVDIAGELPRVFFGVDVSLKPANSRASRLLVRMDAVFAQFESYDWDADNVYKDALHDVLALRLEAIQEQDPLAEAVPSHERDVLAWQTKLYVFCSTTGHILSLDDFWMWQRNHKVVEIHEEPESPAKNGEDALKVAGSTDEPIVGSESNDSESPSGTNNDAPYSSNYQSLVELIIAGKPIPGVKEIPKTVLEGRELALTAAARPKPWETTH